MLLVVGLFFGWSASVKADSTPLSIKAILPANQHDKSVSYYYLMMKPGETQELDVQLFNSSEVDTTALVTLTAATTNDNGLIDYNLPDKELDKSLLYPFTSIAETPKEVVVPAGKDVVTKVKLKMPPEEYTGMVLGGINVTAKKSADEDEKKETGGMQIENQMNYAIGVVLVENEESVKTDMSLTRAYASQIMGSNTMKATLQNPTMAVMEDLSLEAKIYQKGSDTVLYETKQTGYRMAPNSSFDFGIPLGSQPFKAGDYTIKISAVSDPKNPQDGEKQSWELEDTFTVTRKEADELNEKAVGLAEDYTTWYIIGGIAAIIVIGIIVTLLVMYNKQQKQLKAERSKKRKRQPSK